MRRRRRRSSRKPPVDLAWLSHQKLPSLEKVSSREKCFPKKKTTKSIKLWKLKFARFLATTATATTTPSRSSYEKSIQWIYK